MRWTAFAVALVGTAAIAWHVVNAKARRRLEAARSTFGMNGFPTQIEQILPAPRGEADNADALLRRARQTMTGSTDWETGTAAPVFRKIEEIELSKTGPAQAASTGGPPEFDPEQLAAIAALLDDPAVERFFDQVHQATTRATWRQHLEYEKGYALLLPQVAVVRSFVRLLTKRAAVLGRSTEYLDAAWDDLLAAWKLGDWADVEPTLISYLTGVAVRGMIEPHVLTLLSSGQTSAQLDRFIELQKQTVADLPARFVRAVQAERLGLFDVFARDLESRSNVLALIGEQTGLPRRLGWMNPWLDPILSRVGRPRLRHELAICYEFQLRAEIAVAAGDHHMASRLQAISDEVKHDQSILAKIVLPALSPVAARHLLHITQQRELLTLTISVQHHRNTGAWPTTIDELALPAEFVVDACSGQPLILRPGDGWLSVYAFGFDGDDDDGRALPPADMRDGDGDIALRIRRRP